MATSQKAADRLLCFWSSLGLGNPSMLCGSATAPVQCCISSAFLSSSLSNLIDLPHVVSCLVIFQRLLGVQQNDLLDRMP